MFESGILDGRVAYISGGTSGINLGIARTLSRYGAKICVVGRDPERGAAALAVIRNECGGEAMFVAADVRDYEAIESSIKATAERFGPLDIVVAGAAGNFFAPAVSITPKGFKTVVDIDLLGTYHVLRAAFDHCRKPGASFIAITAGQAVNPMPYQAHVCAAKAGINALLKTLAMEWGPAGIRVNGISPGPIADTEGLRRLVQNADAEAALKQKIALRRFGTTDEIGYAVTYLSSSMAGYVTGTILDVEGGFQLGDASADCLTPTR
jgi:NAD(P)-dependent dehydrogenase (short-subunit alcohol dehydrogenase family)